MVSTRKKGHEHATVVAAVSAPAPAPVPVPVPVPVAAQKSKLPGFVRFPLLILLSFTTSIALLHVASDFIDPQLRLVSSPPDEDVQILSTVAWKLVELSLGWFGNFDYIDLCCLTVLSHAPWYYLLHTFYLVEPATLAICLAIDVASLCVPTRLLRARAPVHNPNAPRAAVPNRAIISDVSTVVPTALLSAVVYAVTLFAALQTVLPEFMAVHFEPLPTLARAHTASLPVLNAVMLPVGFAAREFLLVGALAAVDREGDAARKAFDPVTSGFHAHIIHNFWWFKAGTRTLIKRTIVLVALTIAHCASHATVVLKGGDPIGAAGYAGVWATAAFTMGVLYAWVKNT